MPADSTSPQITTLNVNEANGWEIRRVHKSQRRYTSIATIRMANNQVTEPDILDLLGELSKGARDLFLDIKRAMSYQTHTALLPNKGLNQSQINKRSKAIKELESTGRGLACRVPTKGIKNLDDVELRYRPSTFMLSPDYVYPGTKFEKEIRHVWSQAISQSIHRKQSATPTQPHSAPTEAEPIENAPTNQQQDNTDRKSNRPTRSLFRE